MFRQLPVLIRRFQAKSRFYEVVFGFKFFALFFQLFFLVAFGLVPLVIAAAEFIVYFLQARVGLSLALRPLFGPLLVTLAYYFFILIIIQTLYIIGIHKI